MVLDAIVSKVLNRLLGEYVTGFDKQAIRFSLYGSLELENLELKKNILDRLHWPVKIRSGTISKLKLSIPWRHIETETSLISIESLYLLLEPASKSKDNVRIKVFVLFI